MIVNCAPLVTGPVVTACASCYARLRTANHMVREDADERARAERLATLKPGSAPSGSVDYGSYR